MEWKPISEAPKDGTVVLVRGGNMGYTSPTAAAAVFEDGNWHLDMWDSPNEPLENPTHFMPLPPAPEADQ